MQNHGGRVVIVNQTPSSSATPGSAHLSRVGQPNSSPSRWFRAMNPGCLPQFPNSPAKARCPSPPYTYRESLSRYRGRRPPTCLNQLQEASMHGAVGSKLRMKRGSHDVGFLHEHGLPSVLGENLHARADALNDRRSNEDHL